VARDLAAVINGGKNQDARIKMPAIENFAVDNESLKIEVVVEDTEACPRYSGITISGVEVKDSPEWLQTRLKSIGLKPINNIVDATNFVLHELGQPLHAFDLHRLGGNAIVVRRARTGEKLTTLDGSERSLTPAMLVIA